jgi:thymidine kinase
VIGASEDGNDVDGKEKLFKFLFGEEATNKFKFKTNGTILEINRDNYKFLNVSEEHIKELEQYEVIIVDEIGQYNEIELQLIDEIAKKAKIYVIGLGDHCQIGDIVEYTDSKDQTGTANSNYQDVDI